MARTELWKYALGCYMEKITKLRFKKLEKDADQRSTRQLIVALHVKAITQSNMTLV